MITKEEFKKEWNEKFPSQKLTLVKLLIDNFRAAKFTLREAKRLCDSNWHHKGGEHVYNIAANIKSYKEEDIKEKFNDIANGRD